MTLHLDRRALAVTAVAAAVAAQPAAASAYTPSRGAVRAALATERHYMSYGAPQVIPPPPAPALASAPAVVAIYDGPAWTTIAITAFLASMVGGVLGAVAGVAGRRRRRARAA